LHWS